MGFLDRVVSSTDELMSAARQEAETLSALPRGAFKANKLAVRAPFISVIEPSVIAR